MMLISHCIVVCGTQLVHFPKGENFQSKKCCKPHVYTHIICLVGSLSFVDETSKKSLLLISRFELIGKFMYGITIPNRLHRHLIYRSVSTLYIPSLLRARQTVIH